MHPCTDYPFLFYNSSCIEDTSEVSGIPVVRAFGVVVVVDETALAHTREARPRAFEWQVTD